MILSTDDEQIAEIGRRCGIDVPFMRPAELAQDDTPMLPVVQHAVSWLEQRGDRFDAVCVLQPTTPLRRAEHIDSCIGLLEDAGADSVVTVLPVPATYNPHWVYFQGADGFLRLSTGEATPVTRRQELPPALHREGSVYVTRRDVIMEQNSLYGSRLVGFVMDPEETVNIDTPFDWERGEALMSAARR